MNGDGAQDVALLGCLARLECSSRGGRLLTYVVREGERESLGEKQLGALIYFSLPPMNLNSGKDPETS